MKKTAKNTLLWAAVIITLCAVYWGGSNHDNPAKSKQVPASSVNTVSSKKNPANQSCKAVDDFSSLIKSYGDDITYDEFQSGVEGSAVLAAVKNAAEFNNRCGAGAAGILSNIYLHFKKDEQANYYHNKTVEFAQKGNHWAFANLCSGYDQIITKSDAASYCEAIINPKNKSKYDATDKRIARFRLLLKYYDNKEADKLIKLCKNTPKGDDQDFCFVGYMLPSVAKLADDESDSKDYLKAIKLYKEAAPYDSTGITQAKIGDMYSAGEGVDEDPYYAMYWYKEGLKLNINPELWPIMMNSLGLAYESARKYKDAYDAYDSAAHAGYAEAQVNLSRLYLFGYGVMQDYKQAYAWASISIITGLSADDQRQENVTAAKDILEKGFIKADPSGKMLSDAKAIAKKYYEETVLHKNIINPFASEKYENYKKNN